MVLGYSEDKKLKVNILIAVLIQSGNFCFPAPLGSLLNKIFKGTSVSNSPKEILPCRVLAKAGREIGKSLLVRPLGLSYSIFSYQAPLLDYVHMGSITKVYYIFQFTRFSSAWVFFKAASTTFWTLYMLLKHVTISVQAEIRQLQDKITNICICFLKRQQATVSNLQIGWLFSLSLQNTCMKIFLHFILLLTRTSI